VISGANEEDDEKRETLLTELQDLWTKLQVNVQVCDAYRIGRKVKDKSRPILVKLGSEREKWEILRNGKLLKGTNIFINPDLIPEDRMKEAKLRAKLKKLKEDEAKIRGNIRNGILVTRLDDKIVGKYIVEATGDVVEYKKRPVEVTKF